MQHDFRNVPETRQEQRAEFRGYAHNDSTENPRDHIDGVGFDAEEGMANLRRALDDAGIGYEETRIP